MCLCSSTIKPFSGWPLVSLRFATAFAPCKSLWKNASTQTRTKNDRLGGFFTLRPLVVGLTRSGGHLIFIYIYIYIYIYICVCVCLLQCTIHVTHLKMQTPSWMFQESLVNFGVSILDKKLQLDTESSRSLVGCPRFQSAPL